MLRLHDSLAVAIRPKRCCFARRGSYVTLNAFARRPWRQRSWRRLHCASEKENEEERDKKKARRKALGDGSILFMFEDEESEESGVTPREAIEELRVKREEYMDSAERQEVPQKDTPSLDEHLSRQNLEGTTTFVEKHGVRNILITAKASEENSTTPSGEVTEEISTRDNTDHDSLPSWTHEELSQLKVKDLRQLCRSFDIRRVSNLRKADLINAMLQASSN